MSVDKYRPGWRKRNPIEIVPGPTGIYPQGVQTVPSGSKKVAEPKRATQTYLPFYRLRAIRGPSDGGPITEFTTWRHPRVGPSSR